MLGLRMDHSLSSLMAFASSPGWITWRDDLPVEYAEIGIDLVVGEM
jgi:hypothetical protein